MRRTPNFNRLDFSRPALDGQAEKLFVLIGAYNHEPFISQTIQGALHQDVDLPFTILIRDDASSDSTAEIISSYAKLHPDRIVPILYDRNQRALGKGWTPDLLRHVERAVGPGGHERVYVALCEGDDHWVDETKLQRQVNFLREHPTAALVHHDFHVVVEENGSREYERDLWNHLANFKPHPSLRKGSDLVEGNFIMTCTVMMRLSGWKPSEHSQRPKGVLGDWVNFAVASKSRMIGFISRKMSVYRIHGSGLHSNRSPDEISEISIRSSEYIKRWKSRSSIGDKFRLRP